MSGNGSSSSTRSTIFNLPVSKHAPFLHLKPDPLLRSPRDALRLHAYEPPPEINEGPIAIKEGDPVPPSMLRRSRFVRQGGAFTYTSPLPLEFPYDLSDVDVPADGTTEGDKVQAMDVEKRLALLEPDANDVIERGEFVDGLTSNARRTKLPPATLLSFSEACRKAWLPQLDAGEEGSETRKALVEVLGGRTILARAQDGDDLTTGFFPWSLCYGGHQFGTWAGQLGDGRAISIFSTPASKKADLQASTVELQLKGAGRTPYSRFADGLAVLRSSIREYLGAEAVAALRIPTSRALALVGVEDINVRREVMETAAIVTRLAPSWIRIGSFELQADRQEWDSLRQLVAYAAEHVLHTNSASPPTESKSAAFAVLKQSALKNALMVAGWQAYGFCHGVINSDNVQLAGLTIDYGPYAFMDKFNFNHVCNHSDDFGRYSYVNQPAMVRFGIEKLGGALAEMMGAEHEMQVAEGQFAAVEPGWAEDKDKLASWRKSGLDLLEGVRKFFDETYEREYLRLMRLRFGLEKEEKADGTLVDTYLRLLNEHELDFTNSFRLLSQFPGNADPAKLDKFVDLLLSSTRASGDREGAAKQAKEWFTSYEQRLAKESTTPDKRKEAMERVNPRFTLRQWVLEEIIAKMSKTGDADARKEALDSLERALSMCHAPFEPYGEPTLDAPDGGACPTLEERERRRLCDIGPDSFLGFQCSCSS